MTTPVSPQDAAHALTQVRERQAAVLAAAVIPRWYWAALAALVVGFTAAVESGRPVLVAVGTVAFVAGVAACVARVVTGRPMQASNALLGVRGAGLITGFVLATVAVTLGVSFALRAAGVPWSATIGSCVTAVALLAGGPLLMRGVRRIMHTAATRTVA